MGTTGIISLQVCNPVACWNGYTINTQGHTTVTVAHRLDSAHEQLIETNHHYIRTVAEVLLLCAKQDLALQRDFNSSCKPYLSCQGKTSRWTLQYAMYTSPKIQNTLLEIMGSAVRDKIYEAVQEATVFSLLADETKDTSKVKQLDTASVHERFLIYIPPHSTRFIKLHFTNFKEASAKTLSV